MAPRRPLVYKDGLEQQMASPDVLSHPVYTFATLPTLGANDYGVTFCSDYPGMGRCEVFWTGTYWRPLNRPVSAPPYRTSGAFSVSGVMNTSAPTTVTLTPNIRRAWPFHVEHRFTTDRVQFEVTTATAGSLVNVALYYHDFNTGAPGAIIPNTAGVNMSAATIAAVVSSALTSTVVLPSHIWLVMVCSANAVLRSWGVSSYPSWLGYNLAGGANGQINGYQVAAAFGALPASAPLTSGSVMVNTNMPVVQYRLV